MLAIQRQVKELRRIPLVSMLGLVVMVFAGVFDVVVHMLGSPHAGHHEFGPEQLAHLLGIAGMVLILAGVVIDGARRQLRQRAARNGGFDGHAHR